MSSSGHEQETSSSSFKMSKANETPSEQAKGQDAAQMVVSLSGFNESNVDTWERTNGAKNDHQDDEPNGQNTPSYMTPVDDVGLLYYNREPLALKDFGSEVRASMDVEQFAHQAELLLDLELVSMGEIVDSMLEKALASEQLGGEILTHLRESIFIRGSNTLMAHTIQGVQMDGANLKHDQTWLCALCNLAQISRRHMVIARFKRPINMGDSAHHVRLLVLVLVPTKEKSTKGQLETGRTFATMLADSEFRRNLLDAESELEFATLMVLRAQQMANGSKMKNRHKYLFDAALHQSISPDKMKPLSWSNSGSHLFYNTCQQSPVKFSRNPRTSRLFELLIAGEHGQLVRELTNGIELSAIQNEGDTNNVAFVKPIGANEKDSSNSAGAGLCASLEFGRSAWEDFKRRLRYYPSDFRDGFVGPPRTLQKTIATIWFLYFGILLPTIAFSSLNTTQTHGHMGDLRKALIGQAIGGLGFALFGGQPLVIIMTTAPLCLYTRVIHQMCLDYGFHFPSMYAAVGLWNGFFLVLYSMFGFSRLMRWCTRSTEEIFALFIVIAFITDASKDVMQNFHRFYFTPACEAQGNTTTSSSVSRINSTNAAAFLATDEEIEASVCRRETSLLFLLLMLGTLWLSVTLYKFRRTQYLSAGKRDLLADYALPTAVILMSLLGSTVFNDIFVEKFPPVKDVHFERAPIEMLPLAGILTSLALGFTLSLLFFMDQNISAAMVNTPQNKLKKGDAFHYDLLIIGLLNCCLTLFGLPMMHGVLPHSPLHARSLADIEEQVEEGHLHEVVVNARETRVTAIMAHILLFGSLLLIPYPIAYIPRAVLNGLFLYMAITSLGGLQVFERILLLFTEQSNYPPNHYIRRCPQRKIHQFTIMQLIQLLVMCLFGFSPINLVEMFFPVIILLMIPFRHKIVPRYINEKYLDALDGKH